MWVAGIIMAASPQKKNGEIYQRQADRSTLAGGDRPAMGLRPLRADLFAELYLRTVRAVRPSGSAIGSASMRDRTGSRLIQASGTKPGTAAAPAPFANGDTLG